MAEMKTLNDPKLSGWWAKVEEIKKLFGVKYSNFSKIEVIGSKIKICVKSKFEAYWLKQIKTDRVDKDGNSHNKLSLS